MRRTSCGAQRRRVLLLIAGMALSTAGTAPARAQGQATSGEPVTIGAILSVTGPVAGVGQPERDGALLAEKIVNASGGIGGRPLKLVIEDDSSNPDTAISKATGLIRSTRVRALIGSSNLPSTVAIGGLTDSVKLPQVALSGMGPAVEARRTCVVHLLAPQELNARAALAGLLRPSAGAIRFAGRDVTAEPGHRRAGEGMAFVLDNRALFAELTVRQNLALAERMGQRSGRPRCLGDDAELFDLLPVVKERIDAPVQLLSGGQQQMVAIARTLLLRPRLLMLDEPSAGLAPLIVKHILELLHNLKGRGMGILVVEQNVRLIAEVADRGYVMSLGRLVHEVPPGGWPALLDDERLVRAYLGG